MSTKIGIETMLKLWASWKDWILEDCPNNKTVTAVKALVRRQLAAPLLFSNGKEFNLSWCFVQIYQVSELVQEVPEKISPQLDHLREVTSQVLSLMPEVFAPSKDTPLELLNLNMKAMEEETIIEFSSKGFQMHRFWTKGQVTLQGAARLPSEVVYGVIGERVMVTLPKVVMSHAGLSARATYEDSQGAVSFAVIRYEFFPDRGEFLVKEIGGWANRFSQILREKVQTKFKLPSFSAHAVEIPLTGEEELFLEN